MRRSKKNRDSIRVKIDKLKIGEILPRSSFTKGESASVLDYIYHGMLVRTHDQSLIKIKELKDVKWMGFKPDDHEKKLCEFWMRYKKYDKHIPMFYAILKMLRKIPVGGKFKIDDLTGRYKHLKRTTINSYLYFMKRSNILESNPPYFTLLQDLSKVYRFKDIYSDDKVTGKIKPIKERSNNRKKLQELAEKIKEMQN